MQASLRSPTHKTSHTNHSVLARIMSVSSQQAPVEPSGFSNALFLCKKKHFSFSFSIAVFLEHQKIQGKGRASPEKRSFLPQAAPVVFSTQVQDVEVVSLRGTGHLASVALVSGASIQLLAGLRDVSVLSRQPSG